jgi:hypothetical protein
MPFALSWVPRFGPFASQPVQSDVMPCVEPLTSAR